MQKVKWNSLMRTSRWPDLTRYFPDSHNDEFAVLIHKITQLSIETGIKIAQNLIPPTDDTVSEAGRSTRGRKLPDFKKMKTSRSSSVPAKVCIRQSTSVTILKFSGGIYQGRGQTHGYCTSCPARYS